ncbi:MAG: YdcF family protein [Gammaproteobacteria bacterium]|nr:MAG: YdcF family protein [Gammaproteobacteria bacterium]
MDIFIIYVIKTLLLPLSSLILLAIIGLFLLPHKRSLSVMLISFSLGALLLLSLPVVAKYLATTQEIYPPVKDESLHEFSAQAIIVLGGGLRRPAPEYKQQATLKNRTLARVRYAAFLARKTHLPLLVTGGKVLKKDLPAEAEIMTAVLNNEFNQKVHWQETNSRNTAENAEYSWQILSQYGVQRIILVTHALHMRRAVEQFELHGFEVMPAPTVFLSRTGTLGIFSFLPSATALQRSSLVIHEIMGRAWYKLRY